MQSDKCGLVQKKYVPLFFLRGNRAAVLSVNMLRDNIEMYFKNRASNFAE
jgi:hypothetical protein